MDIGGYTNMPSPPPLEHPNSARSSKNESPKLDGKSSDKSKDGSPSPNKEWSISETTTWEEKYKRRIMDSLKIDKVKDWVSKFTSLVL